MQMMEQRIRVKIRVFIYPTINKMSKSETGLIDT